MIPLVEWAVLFRRIETNKYQENLRRYGLDIPSKDTRATRPPFQKNKLWKPSNVLPPHPS